MNRTESMFREKKGSLLLIFISLLIPIVSAYVYQQQSQSMTQYILNTRSYYDPSLDVATYGWLVNGSSTHYGAIDDGIRNTSTPILTDFIYSHAKRTDEIGFPDISESGVTSIILWVYSETGSNALTIIDLKNGGSIQTTLTINPSSPQGWRSTVWLNPSSIGSISVDFTHDKQGGGTSTDSTVYAAYIEVIFAP